MAIRKYLIAMLLLLLWSTVVNWAWVRVTPPTATDIAQLIKSGSLSKADLQLIRDAVGDVKEPLSYYITVRYLKGETVYWPPLWDIKIINATYGYGDPESECLRKYRAWGTPGLVFCKKNYTSCTEGEKVIPEITTSVFKVGPPFLPDNGKCPQNREVLEMTIKVPRQPPNCDSIAVCNGKGKASITLTVKGMFCDCECKPGYTGVGCRKCEAGYYNWPDCLPVPFTMDIVNHKKTHPDNTCPDGLVEHRCDNSKIPRPLWHPAAGPSFLSVLGCGIASLPWACEFGLQKTQRIESITTIATREFLGAHLLLLLESISIYAQGVCVYVGVDSEDVKDRLSEAFSKHERFHKVSFVVLQKTPSLAFWYHEKPQIMKHALHLHRTTLWMDADAFLVSELRELPDTPLTSFGCGVHDPRGWGSSVLPHRNGFVNSGVIFARNDTLHLDAWNNSMIRHDQLNQSPDYFKGQEPLYLDQGPLDISFTNTKGAFKLEPQWNVAWWTPDARLEDWRPNWWLSERNYGSRIAISPSKETLVLDNTPILIVHSHFVKEEKHYWTIDSHFNSLIFELMQSAAPGTKLSEMSKRLQRYATHLVTQNRESVSVKKLSWEFLDTIVTDWDIV